MYPNEATFNALKTRYEEFKASGFEGGDSEIVPLLESLNRRDDVVPVWSCGSHPEDDEESDRFSIVVSCLPGGEEFMRRWYQGIFDVLLKDFNAISEAYDDGDLDLSDGPWEYDGFLGHPYYGVPHTLKLEFGHLINPLNDTDWHPVYTLVADIDSDELKEWFLETALAELERLHNRTVFGDECSIDLGFSEMSEFNPDWDGVDETFANPVQIFDPVNDIVVFHGKRPAPCNCCDDTTIIADLGDGVDSPLRR